MDAPGGRPVTPRTQLLPQLSVRRGRAALDFYAAAFGAVEVFRIGGTDDDESVVAQLAIGSASFWVADESPPHRNFSPESLGGGSVRMLLIVDDPEAVVRQAVAAGAREVAPVAEEHGWRLGRVEDPFGHDWEIGQPLGAWPPRRPHAAPADTHERAATVAEVAAVLAAVADVLPRGVTMSAEDMEEYVEAFRALRSQGEDEPDSQL